MSEMLKKRHNYLKLVMLMLEETSVLIRFKACTVFEIASSLQNDARFKELEFLDKIDVNSTDLKFSELWSNAVNEVNISYLKKKDLECLLAIGNNLGNSDIEGQLSNILLEKEEIKFQINEAETEENTKSKMFRTLGVLSGAFISLIII